MNQLHEILRISVNGQISYHRWTSPEQADQVGDALQPHIKNWKLQGSTTWYGVIHGQYAKWIVDWNTASLRINCYFGGLNNSVPKDDREVRTRYREAAQQEMRNTIVQVLVEAGIIEG